MNRMWWWSSKNRIKVCFHERCARSSLSPTQCSHTLLSYSNHYRCRSRDSLYKKTWTMCCNITLSTEHGRTTTESAGLCCKTSHCHHDENSQRSKQEWIQDSTKTSRHFTHGTMKSRGGSDKAISCKIMRIEWKYRNNRLPASSRMIVLTPRRNGHLMGGNDALRKEDMCWNNETHSKHIQRFLPFCSAQRPFSHIVGTKLFSKKWRRVWIR